MSNKYKVKNEGWLHTVKTSPEALTPSVDPQSDQALHCSPITSGPDKEGSVQLFYHNFSLIIKANPMLWVLKRMIVSL